MTVPGTYKNSKGGVILPDRPTDPEVVRPYFGTVGVLSGERASYTEFWVTLMRNVAVMGEGVATKVAMSVDIPGNCNTICRSSRERQDDWVWIMGDDHVWGPELLPRLIEHDVDIVVPNCLMRNPPWKSVVFSRQDENGWYVMAQQDGDMPEDGLFEIHAAGSAGMLIRGYVLDAIGDPYFRPDPGGVGLNEDIFFCQRAREAGFKIYCDAGAILGHISKYTVWPEFRDGHWQVSMEFDQKPLPIERIFVEEVVARMKLPEWMDCDDCRQYVVDNEGLVDAFSSVGIEHDLTAGQVAVLLNMETVHKKEHERAEVSA